MLPKSTKKAINMAIPKATRSSSMKAPKEKHVKNLVGATLTRDPAVVEEILRGLCKRLEKNNWVVILKTLMIFHRIFREGDPAFIEALRTRSAAIFALKRFSVTAPSGNIYTLFVQKYAKYLEENVSVLRLIGFNFERNKDSLKGLAPKEAFKRVPKLQSQLNALLNCKMRQHHIGRNALIISTYMLLLKDSLVLYPMLNVGVIGLIDQCFKMRKKEAQRVLDIYSLFVKETEALINLYDISKTFTNRLPPIHPAKATLIDVLNAHIAKMDDTAGGDGDISGEEAGGGVDGHGHDMEPETDDSHYSTSTGNGNGSSSAANGGDDSDTSSGDSSDDEAASGGFGSFDFGFGATATAPAQGGGAQSQQQQFQQQQQQQQQQQLNSRASVGPNSWNFLAQQFGQSQQQAGNTTSGGWDIFDRPTATSSANGGGAMAPSSSSPSIHQHQPAFFQQDPNDPFAAFNSLSITSTNPNNSSSPMMMATSPSGTHVDAIPYQDRAATVKAGMGHLYAQQPPQQRQGGYDNPFGAPLVPSASGNVVANPFGDNPFGPTSTSPVPNRTPPVTTTTSPAPASTGGGSYNPFL